MKEVTKYLLAALSVLALIATVYVAIEHEVDEVAAPCITCDNPAPIVILECPHTVCTDINAITFEPKESKTISYDCSLGELTQVSFTSTSTDLDASNKKAFNDCVNSKSNVRCNMEMTNKTHKPQTLTTNKMHCTNGIGE